ncbi:MAG: hypothetical protein Q9165_007323 [Trypethelium subeluteriae]
MSYYPGQQYHQQQGGYGPPQYPPQGYPPQPQYGPPQGYGYGTPSPQPPQNYGYSSPPPPVNYGGYNVSEILGRQLSRRSYEVQSGPPPPQYGGYGPPNGAPQYNQSSAPTYQNSAYMHGNHSAPPPPPQQAQHFGSGAPGGYTFQYSTCTGRRKALLIGINYFSQRGQLRGCINDVKNMSTYLNQHFGYKREDMVILTDDQQNPMSQPTKANILRAMHWLVKDAQPNDSLFFHYSGHGGQTKDLDGDEDDGYDEVIYPVDFRNAGHIVDDEMHRIITQGVLKEPNLAKEAGQGLLGIVSSYARGDIGSMLSTGMGLIKKATSGNDTYERNIRTKTSAADVIMWSGSKDSQTSSDAQIAGEATGAMSWAFVTALKKNPQQSYVQLLRSIRDELQGKYSQKPQLSCSHPLNTELLYVM